MAFGQHTEGTKAITPDGAKAVANVGRRSVKDMRAALPADGWHAARRTAHNEITRRYGGVEGEAREAVVRLHETDILTIYRSGAFLINSGGWFTMTTRTHINDALKRHGLPGRVRNASKARGVGRLVYVSDAAGEVESLTGVVFVCAPGQTERTPHGDATGGCEL